MKERVHKRPGKSGLVWTAVSAMLGLALAACGRWPPQAVETATAVVETPQITREVTAGVTEEAPRVTREPTATREVVDEPTRQPEEEPVEIVLWTVEGEADGGLQFVRMLAGDYASRNPHVSLEVVGKDPETLREDFLTAGRVGGVPDLAWTVNEHTRPFHEAGMILPLDDVFELDKHVDSALAGVELDGQTWGLPVENGGHLMLIYNHDLIAEPPQTTDSLIAVGEELTVGDQYALVYNQMDPRWLVPWLGGFTGSVFAEDGRTPTLGTPEMVDALHFLYDIQYTTPLVPGDSDYDGARVLFTKGMAAMIIDGEWALPDYRRALGDRLGAARIPRVSATGEWPQPYVEGISLMFPVNLKENSLKLEAAVQFARFVTSAENQALLATELNRLPASKEALGASAVTDDPILKGSADQMIVGRPAPAVREMRCNWDAMGPEMQAVLGDAKSPEQAAADMQRAAESCVEGLGQ